MPIGGGGAGGGGGGKNVRAGGAYFELFAKDNLSDVLDRMKKKAVAFAGFMASVGKASAIAGAGLAAPLAALFKGGIDRAADAAKMSQQLGIPIELMSKLQYAAEEAGVSVEEVMKDTTGRFKDAIDSAPSIDPQRARQAVEMQREMARATFALQQAMLPLLDTIVPIVKNVAEFAKNNAGAVRTAAAAAAGLLAFAAGVKLATLAFVGLKAIALTTYGIIASPFLIGAAAGALFSVGVIAALGDMQGFTNFLIKGFVGAARTAQQAWGGIADAIGKGDLVLAGKIALKGLEVVWLDFVETMTIAWVGFKMTFVDAWHDIATAAKVIWAEFNGWLIRTMTAPVERLLVMARGAASALGLDEQVAKLDGALAAVRAADTSAEDVRGIKEKAQAEQDARNLARMSEIAEAMTDLKTAKEELAALTAEAAAPAAAAPAGNLAPLAEQFRAAEAVKGGFSSSALGQQFGVSDKAQKQIELLKQLNGGEGALPGKIGAAVGAELRIK